MSGAADTAASLTWTGAGLRFDAANGRTTVRISGDDDPDGFGPLEALLAGIGGCMAADVVDILVKMRREVVAYRVDVRGWRARDHPRRFLRIQLVHRLEGDATEAQVRRAIELSFTKYCSAMGSLDPSMEIENELLLGAAAEAG